MSLYHQLAEDIAQQIASGTLRPGERLPSVRQLCATRHVSASTVLHAYRLLEDHGLVVTRGCEIAWIGPNPEHERRRDQRAGRDDQPRQEIGGAR